MFESENGLTHWDFKCDGCGRQARCNTGDLAHAIESLRAAGWLIGMNTELEIWVPLDKDRCPACAEARL